VVQRSSILLIYRACCIYSVCALLSGSTVNSLSITQRCSVAEETLAKLVEAIALTGDSCVTTVVLTLALSSTAVHSATTHMLTHNHHTVTCEHCLLLHCYTTTL
jgi:hypothetical protein